MLTPAGAEKPVPASDTMCTWSAGSTAENADGAEAGAGPGAGAGSVVVTPGTGYEAGPGRAKEGSVLGAAAGTGAGESTLAVATSANSFCHFATLRRRPRMVRCD